MSYKPSNHFVKFSLANNSPQQQLPPPPTPLLDVDINEEPIHMWDPTSRTHNTMPSASNSPAPQTGRAIIDNKDKAPPCPAHMPLAHPSQPALVQEDNDAPPIASRPQTHAQLQT
jgi:hypothetical protein